MIRFKLGEGEKKNGEKDRKMVLQIQVTYKDRLQIAPYSLAPVIWIT